MKPDISEFSYGYALTEALIWDTSLPVIGAPIFPSLIQEGRSGGYDVGIQFEGVLLFLQFKLSHYMKKATAFEMLQGFMDVPFYRMHLRPTNHSRQHPMLLALEAAGEIVYYAAPKFHLPSELNRAYLSRTMIQQSLFIQPSTIGTLPDEGEHHVSFRNGYPVYLCSEPRKIREKEDSETSLKELYRLVDRTKQRKYDDSALEKLNEQMFSIVLKHQLALKRAPLTASTIPTYKKMNPVEKLRYLSRTYFDCEPIIFRKR